MAVLLTACGGGGSASSDLAGTQAASGAGAGSPEAARRADPAAFQRSAALSSADLASAEQQAQAAEASAASLDELDAGEIAAKSAYQSGAVARKALAMRIPVYRFSNSSTGAHFFTTSVSERDNVANTLSPPYSLEGEAFSVASAYSPGLSPVHRFFNTQNGVHFYTISETERANVVANFPQFSYEGVAYYASQVAGAGLIPFYRFYVPSKGFHFYTASEAERNSIVATLSAVYSYEGVGYYVLDSNWLAEKLPHSGVTSDQCYEAGNDFLVTCSSDNAMNLNPQQDGHRVAINPMSYGTVGSNQLTSCVRDNVTGLIWEGKETNDTRAGSNVYTNLGNGLANDTSGYVAAVNTANLCGFSDWRVPARHELIGIVDFGRVAAPSINTIWFPNTAETDYWGVGSLSTDANVACYVSFAGRKSGCSARTDAKAVRLVRGNSPSGSRFSYSTALFGGDAPNNIVNDAWTGLQWRRCVQGQVWSGSTCTGTPGAFVHVQALDHARTQSGWRLPNVKELSSLVDQSVGSSAARIDPIAFPGASAMLVWSSSPYAGNPYGSPGSWGVVFGNGDFAGYYRGLYLPVRLVRDIR
ncbi:hypothetical protein LPB072_02990 [Hydrogenophaga crassostreae]|uniref:DUF1566 domain-containing protein n=1 Tax=Hydrogenophaga crassostreae TaxID=1763535 RepID=A0A1D8NSA1_9BURK|nr:hypothetical protein LPB072_02990 [Hydrogenophaga crassostreae]